MEVDVLPRLKSVRGGSGWHRPRARPFQCSRRLGASEESPGRKREQSAPRLHRGEKQLAFTMQILGPAFRTAQW
eukprot:9478070-Pyramimonas_sp.AAC.1